MSKTIGEQLAELCGMETYIGQHDKLLYAVGGESIRFDVLWHPTADMNQLKMCYEAAENTVGDEFHARFYIELTFALVDKGFNTTKDLTAAWVKHPELVAQAILKAKGVS